MSTTFNEMLFTDEEKDLIWRTKANGASADEFATFIHIAQRCGLDPRANQIYFVKRQNKGTIQVGIDGLRLVADRTGRYAGSDDAEITGEDQTGKYPNAAKVVVYKMVDGQRCPFGATARWSEYYPGDGAGMQWRKMPCVMLAKVAEALALRKAFPADLSGLYTSEEMDQADRPETPAQRPQDPKAPTASGASNAEARTSEPTKDARSAETAGRDAQSAFGYVPAKWPSLSAFEEPRTEPQRGKAHAEWKTRELPDDYYGIVRTQVLKAFGFEGHDKKGHMMLWIDFLINASPESVAEAIKAANAELGQEPLL